MCFHKDVFTSIPTITKNYKNTKQNTTRKNKTNKQTNKARTIAINYCRFVNYSNNLFLSATYSS